MLFYYIFVVFICFFFFFQAEDGIRDGRVTGVQTCALPISTFRHYNTNNTQSPLVPCPGCHKCKHKDNRGNLCISEANNTDLRSEERRVGKECRSRWSTDH